MTDHQDRERRRLERDRRADEQAEAAGYDVLGAHDSAWEPYDYRNDPDRSTVRDNRTPPAPPQHGGTRITPHDDHRLNCVTDDQLLAVCDAWVGRWTTSARAIHKYGEEEVIEGFVTEQSTAVLLLARALEYATRRPGVGGLNLEAEFRAEGRTRWSEADADGNVTIHRGDT